MRTGAVNSSSTDYADVSWNVPAVSMTAATFVPGVPAHSWQATACAGSTVGVKGMMVAAKSMALTTVDLFTDPAHIQKARTEFDRKRGPNFVYKTRLADRKPALDYRK
jgi:aminobenzoyl-glutamate utilization protein B